LQTLKKIGRCMAPPNNPFERATSIYGGKKVSAPDQRGEGGFMKGKREDWIVTFLMLYPPKKHNFGKKRSRRGKKAVVLGGGFGLAKNRIPRQMRLLLPARKGL